MTELTYETVKNCRRIFNRAVRRGELVAAKACERCGEVEPFSMDAHHPDYTRPLEVVWLCRSCHVRLHKGKQADNLNALVDAIDQCIEDVPAAFDEEERLDLSHRLWTLVGRLRAELKLEEK